MYQPISDEEQPEPSAASDEEIELIKEIALLDDQSLDRRWDGNPEIRHCAFCSLHPVFWHCPDAILEFNKSRSWEELKLSNTSTSAKNDAAYEGLNTLAQEQAAKYLPLKEKADKIKSLSSLKPKSKSPKKQKEKENKEEEEKNSSSSTTKNQIEKIKKEKS